MESLLLFTMGAVCGFGIGVAVGYYVLAGEGQSTPEDASTEPGDNGGQPDGSDSGEGGTDHERRRGRRFRRPYGRMRGAVR